MILIIDGRNYYIKISYNTDTHTYWARIKETISFGYSLDDAIKRLANRIRRRHALENKKQKQKQKQKETKMGGTNL